MANETLSQIDIDRLLSSDSDKMTPRSTASLDVQKYDFRRPYRVSKDRLRTLEAMYERLVKNLEGWLISRVRGQMEIRLQSVEQFSFGEFTLSLPTPCSSFVFDIKGTGQKGVIDIGQEFAYFIIDKVFGGDGSSALPMRPLTPIERMAVRIVADRVSLDLQEVWADHVPLEIEVSGFESSPEILQVVNRADPVLVANIEILAGSSSSLLLICLPFSVLEKFFSTTGNERPVAVVTNVAERDAARARSESSLRATRVPVEARLPTFQISLRDLAQLQVGYVMPTNIPKDARVIVRAGTQERFIGHPGRVGGNVAVRILDAVQVAPSVSDSSN
ncbi:MAG: FliM/FliN family flagellar motor switch protein [Gemmatimonadaceae bacterium]